MFRNSSQERTRNLWETKEILATCEAVAAAEELVSKLAAPRAVWIMLPAGGVTEQMIQTLIPLLEKGDTIIDGGNTNFNDDIRRAEMLKQHGLNYIDQGTSGGILGASSGYCVMVGGDDEAVALVEPLSKAIAMEDGYIHAGPVGAGHYVIGDRRTNSYRAAGYIGVAELIGCGKGE